MKPALFLAAVLAPALALAQEAPPPPPPGGASAPTGHLDRGPERWERMEKRMRLARALGLAEALDLDAAQAAKMNEIMVGFDGKRTALVEQLRKSVRVLRDAAREPPKDGKAPPAPSAQAVDQAVAAIFDARAQLLALDKDMFQALAKGLGPEKRARMALFFARFRQRFGMEILERAEHGPGPGFGPHRMAPPTPGGPPKPWDG
ncbi:MAG TPA: hypothetical protein VMT17_16055 [Anaeromyxobacteraceae bacterium]|nr:hypothetical protein [Anaeromyxobacteraceae bacterium]